MNQSGFPPIGWAPTQPSGDCQNQTNRDVPADNKQDIRQAIKDKFTKAAVSTDNLFKYQTGKQGALELGYNESWINCMTDEQMASFCGVGNPFYISDIPRNSTVLDVGCGSGIDLVVASKVIGDTGKLIGVDITQAMLDRAQTLTRELQVNVELKLIDSEKLPLADNSIDTVISNGVFNLSPDKKTLFKEIFRVLKPNGKLQFADITLESEVPAHLKNANNWSDWIGGAISVGDQIQLMVDAGFEQVTFLNKTVVKNSQYTRGAMFSGIANK